MVEVDARYLPRPTGQAGVDLNEINAIFLFSHFQAFNPIHNLEYSLPCGQGGA